MESRNPVLSRYNDPEIVGATLTTGAGDVTLPTTTAPTRSVSIDDVLIRTTFLLALLVTGGLAGWVLAYASPVVLWGSLVAGIGLAMANALMKTIRPALILTYALVQGVFLGAISRTFQDAFSEPGTIGVVGNAVVATMVAFAVMLVLYRTGLIKVTGRFKKMMLIAMVSYLVIGLASLVSAFLGVGEGWGFYGMGALGIGLAVIGVALASFSLVLDFDAISVAIAVKAPEREGWRLAFGLVVTLVWLYIELLRLFSIIASANR